MQRLLSRPRLIVALGGTVVAFATTLGIHAATQSQSEMATRVGQLVTAQHAGARMNPRFLETDFVLVDVDVKDAGGQPVAGLRAADFHVLDDNVVQSIESFEPYTANGKAPYYVIGYGAPTAGLPGAYHQIKVLVGRPGLSVKYRAGYYADQDAFTEGTYSDDTADLVRPVVQSQVEPKYTAQAIRAKVQGAVVVEAVVGTDGTVIRARVATSLDQTYGLDDEALKAVKHWTFTPGELRGEKVPVLVRLALTFRLH
jgi:TonB family protein